MYFMAGLSASIYFLYLKNIIGFIHKVRQDKRDISRVCEYKACSVKNIGNSGEMMVVMVSFSFKSP